MNWWVWWPAYAVVAGVVLTYCAQMVLKKRRLPPAHDEGEVE